MRDLFLQYSRFCADFNVYLLPTQRVQPVLEHKQIWRALTIGGGALVLLEWAIAVILAVNTLALEAYLSAAAGVVFSLLLTWIAAAGVAAMSRARVAFRLVLLADLKRKASWLLLFDAVLIVAFLLLLRMPAQYLDYAQQGLELATGIAATIFLPISAAVVFTLGDLYNEGIVIFQAIQQLERLSDDLEDFPPGDPPSQPPPLSGAPSTPFSPVKAVVRQTVHALALFALAASANAQTTTRNEIHIGIDQSGSLNEKLRAGGASKMLEALPVILRRHRPTKVVVFGFSDNPYAGPRLGTHPIAFQMIRVCEASTSIRKNERDRQNSDCEKVRKAEEANVESRIREALDSVSQSLSKGKSSIPGCTDLVSTFAMLAADPKVKVGILITDGNHSCGPPIVLPETKAKLIMLLLPPERIPKGQIVMQVMEERRQEVRKFAPTVLVCTPNEFAGDEF